MSSHANDFKKWKKSRILRQTDFELLLICVLNSIHFNTNSENHTPFPEKKLILLCLFVIIHCFSYQWFVVNIFYYYGFFGMHFFEFLIKQVTILQFFFKIFISIYFFISCNNSKNIKHVFLKVAFVFEQKLIEMFTFT